MLWRWRERPAQYRKHSPTEQLERQREFHVASEAFGVLLTCRARKDFGLLYLGQGEDERISPARQHQLNRLGFERGGNEPEAYGLLPISAADLGSEDRVAQALRWWLTGSRLRRYAPRIPGPRALLDLPC